MLPRNVAVYLSTRRNVLEELYIYERRFVDGFGWNVVVGVITQRLLPV